MNKIKAFILFVLVFWAVSCKKEKTVVKENPVIQEIIDEVRNRPEVFNIRISADEIKSKAEVMFSDKDDEEKGGKHILLHHDLRGFRVNELLEFHLTNDKKLRVRNFLPYTFKNVTILLDINGYKNPIKFITFDEIPSFVWYEAKLPLKKEETFFEDVTGKTISLENLNRISHNRIKFSVKTNDPMWGKISVIKARTLITFHDYKNIMWDIPRASDARVYIPMMVNAFYLFSSEEFKTQIKNAPYDFYNGGGEKVESFSDALTNSCVDRKYQVFYNLNVLTHDFIINSFLSIPHLKLGVIKLTQARGAQGLGGGSTFGIIRTAMDNYSKSAWWNVVRNLNIWRGPCSDINTFSHELGHCAGYGHLGNMTYSLGRKIAFQKYLNPEKTKIVIKVVKGSKEYYDAINLNNREEEQKGFVPVFIVTYQKLLKENKLPFSSYPYVKEQIKLVQGIDK